MAVKVQSNKILSLAGLLCLWSIFRYPLIA